MTALRLEVPRKMLPFITERRRHKIARGGRGSAKSWTVARTLIARSMRQRTRWLCCREIQKSIKQSSHKLLETQIDKLGLRQFYDVRRDVIRGPHGSEFIFTGLQDHTSDTIKSFEDLDGAWVEEAHTVSNRSANILIPTVRGKGSEIWWSYNPDEESDFVHEMAERGGPNVLVVDINWRDNPYFPEELELERQELKRINEDLYQHVWEGKCRSAAGLLFKRVWFKYYDTLPGNLNLYMGSDWAVTDEALEPEKKLEPDWTEHGIFGLDHNGDCYIVDWWSGQVDIGVSIEAWCAMVKRHNPRLYFDEAGVISRAVTPGRNKRSIEEQAFVQTITLPSASSKAARALSFAARVSIGTVYLPRNAPWTERLVNQLCAFNGQPGRTDDMVDACSIFARGLNETRDALPPPPPPPPASQPFTGDWVERHDREDADDAAARARYYR